ncbi:MAG: hypothetical protein J2P37_29120 [Ktedonobacteraceae bacterium]|nr:hypothetical protein [Ktedonobacteraceae bacterium]MBO0794680.1 hypothetical protein [Ktedonobacteraceae bacterium]
MSQGLSTFIDLFIWVLALLLGTALGAFGGKLLGTFLGWIVANSLDKNLIRGGHVGRCLGQLTGISIGLFLGASGALYLTTLIAQHVLH